ncbi:HlyC/CorC family transporter [Bacteroidales bacterium AH-315-I05]|nr:HlyC/CorC family transporter [Bacteroidales bacterium AH-315-I05]
MASNDLILIILTLVFSAFFSGMEIAFVSANKLKIELDKKQGAVSAKIISRFLQRPTRFIGAMLVGNNIALVIYGIVMAKILEPPIERYISINEIVVLSIQTIISTLVILVTAEFLPKAVFRGIPNRMLNAFSVPLFLIYYILWLPMLFITSLSEWLLKTFMKVDLSENKMTFGRVDLDHYVSEMSSQAGQKGEVENEIQILQNALEFSNVKARECMVPRTEIVALSIESPVEELREKFIETGLSKILIYRDSVDNIIGYTHSFELFKKPKKIKNILLPVSIVPETIAASEILETFIQKQKSIAVVVDEFGGTSGMLTIEDVVEEIFGEIEDEHDVGKAIERKINETEYEFSARLEIDYLNEKYQLNLPESDQYETLAGLILQVCEDIPEEGENIKFESWVFEIKSVAENRIEFVKVKNQAKE